MLPQQGGEIMSRKAIDVASNCGPSASKIRDNGIDIVLRYYTQYAGGKRLTRAEAVQLANAGLHLAVVYQDYNNSVDRFSAAIGAAQATTALGIANAVGQPAGSAIYVAVDFDATTAEIKSAIVPHFAALKSAFAANGTAYKLGAYGSGLTLSTLLDSGLIDYSWLSLSTGFQGSKEFKASNRWHILQLKEVSNWNGLHVDLNDINDKFPDIGEFIPTGAISGITTTKASTSLTSIVTARSGLQLRGGPATSFAALRTLAYGTTVQVLSRSGDWALVDLEGDGKSDGYVFATYLQMA